MNVVLRALHRSMAVDLLWVSCVLGNFIHHLNHHGFGNCQKEDGG